jgi:signal transduction histidine kinase
MVQLELDYNPTIKDTVIGDVNRISQVLNNFASNAVSRIINAFPDYGL